MKAYMSRKATLGWTVERVRSQISTTTINHYMRESAAWTVSSNFARALGMKSLAPHGGGPEFQVWNKGWKAADVETMRAKGLAKIMDYMSLKPTDTDTYSSEHQHKDQ